MSATSAPSGMGTEAMRAQWQTLRHLPGGLAPVVLGALLLLALLALLALTRLLAANLRKKNWIAVRATPKPR